jgi:CPA2 family monovalent cation:H+ antiporter-2
LEEIGIGLDLVIILTTALVGGFLARQLKLPVILGYLVAGVIIGPYGLGLINELSTIELLATVGVILLLFTLGLNFSIGELRAVGKVAVFGGIAQILITAAFGLLAGNLLGWETAQSIFFGFLIALSSTMIVLKILMERGELDASHGRVMIGILLVQDLSLVPLMIILPALGSESSELWSELGIAVFQAAAFLVLMTIIGFGLIPRLLKRIAATRSSELFLLAIIGLSIASAVAAVQFGVSAAIGAFIAGLIIGQSIYARQAFADILPLRDIFSALFFVSLGMLANTGYAAANPSTITVVVLVTVLVKFSVIFTIIRLFGYPLKTTLLAGLGLIQIGEFSFVLAGVGLNSAIITEDIYSIVLVSAIITMILTPFAIKLADNFYRRFAQKGVLGRLTAGRSSKNVAGNQLHLSGHAVICGQGRIGSVLADVLLKRKFSFLVIETDPVIVFSLKARGIPCLYGDATIPAILEKAQLEKARVFVCTFPNAKDVELAAENALKINPRLDIIARLHSSKNAEILKGIGVTELVRPEFEASLEITRHTLHRLGLPTLEIQYILNRLRRKGELKDL